MPLSLSFFGPFRAAWDGQPLAFATNPARALLAYLAAEAAQSHSREKLAALLWPDQPQSAAFANLRQTVSRVRKAIPDPPGADAVLQIEVQALRFRREVATSDLAQFEALLAECAAHTHTSTSTHSGTSPHADMATCPACIHRLQEAAGVYRGEFLQGLFLERGGPFEEWVLLRRERLHQQMLAVLGTLTCHFEAASDYEGMRRYALRQLEWEPLREDAHAQLMRALAFSGQRSAALLQFEACCDILQRELGIGPGNEIRALAERIRNDELSPATSMVRLPRHNLPEQLTPFVGREDELSTIAARLGERDIRLLTLVGPGGMGKTRLALEAGRARLDDFADGVFCVSLAPLDSASAIVPAIASAISISLHGSDLKQALLQSLHNKRLLLIADNFEHVLDGAPIVVDILQAAPGVKVVVTSRHRLGVRGEQVIEVSGMAYPSGASSPDATTSAAVQLFAQSARRAQANFTLSETTLLDVTRICRLVDGMPLGLELAAAWAGALPLDSIAAEIEGSADFLQADWPDAPERQRSLRGVFDWSWALLNDAERQVLRRLSVFRGGFTREATQTVAGASLRALTSLVHKSLVRWGDARGTIGTGRYEIHELLRQFAAEKLAMADGAHEKDETSERHGAYYLTFAGKMATALYSGASHKLMAEVQADVGNIRQACAWAIDHARLQLLHDHAPALSSLYNLLGLLQEGQQLMQSLARLGERVLANGDVAGRSDDREWAAALAAKSLVERARYLATEYLFGEGSEAAQSALAYAQLAGDVDSEAGALLYWSECAMSLGDVEDARHMLERALERTELTSPYHAPESGRGTPLLKAMILTFLATASVLQDRYVDASEYGERSLRLCTEAHDWLGKARVAFNLGGGQSAKGRYAQARGYLEQALLVNQFPNSLINVRILQELGRVALYCGNHDDADLHLRQALISCRERGDGLSEALTLGLLSRLACYRGECVTARDYASLGAALAHELGNSHSEGANLCSLGDALVGLHCPDEAVAAFQNALTCFDAVGATLVAAEPKAGLASIALARGDLERAMSYVEDIWRGGSDWRIVGLDEPFFVCLVCYRVLQAASDGRATIVLDAARALLDEYAEHITDDALRRSFLENVPAHRELYEIAVGTLIR